MAKVAATILATTPEEFAKRIDRVKPFVKRVHVDVSDGIFTNNKTVGLGQVYGVDGAQLDLHLMVKYPENDLQNALTVEADLIICHFEAEGDLRNFIDRVKEVGIKVGLAIKKETTIEQVKELLPLIDHLLVFTGYLGFNGGEFDAEVLDKIAAAKEINPNLEVGVDGGIDQQSARLAIAAGADVLDSGSFIHNSPDPEAAYIGLEAIAEGTA